MTAPQREPGRAKNASSQEQEHSEEKTSLRERLDPLPPVAAGVISAAALLLAATCGTWFAPRQITLGVAVGYLPWFFAWGFLSYYLLQLLGWTH